MRNITIQFLDNNGQFSIHDPYEVDNLLIVPRLRGLCPATVDGSYDWMNLVGRQELGVSYYSWIAEFMA